MRPLGLLLLASPMLAPSATAGVPFAIEVVDASTGRGVPLIELRTVNEVRLVTDSAGVVAFDEPGLMGKSVFFHVRGHGYEFPRDGFGFRGKALDVSEGGKARLEVRRLNVAERLYRSTGAGIYRDSVLVGRKPPTRDPVLNADVLGSDSVLEATFQGKIHWFWGDTNRPGYPLGNFGSPTATSLLPTDGGLDPEIGVDLDYARSPDGFAAPSAKLAGDGPTWLDGLTVLKERDGKERMFAAFAKIRPPLETYRRGIAEFDPKARRFVESTTIPLDAPIRPFGHPFHHVSGGVEYVYFADPYPIVRVRAEVASFLDLGQYESFTCLLPGSSSDRPIIDRADNGSPRYAWRQGAPPLDAQRQARLVKSGEIRQADALFHLQDFETGRPVIAHRGSVYRNDYRDRWTLIATEIGGVTSQLGEVWYAEAETPLGPWVYARKVATHDKYSFYNPKQHPAFAKDGGRTIFFEGTYTVTFAGNIEPTPRYEYNQVAYKLDLGDARLNLPTSRDETGAKPRPGERAEFLALDRPGPDTIAVGGFHANSPTAKELPGTILLFETGERRYTIRPDPTGRPVARVWKNPMSWTLPAE